MPKPLKTGRVRKTSPTTLKRASACFEAARANPNLFGRTHHGEAMLVHGEALLDEVAILRPSVLALQAEVKLLTRRIRDARNALVAQ